MEEMDEARSTSSDQPIPEIKAETDEEDDTEISTESDEEDDTHIKMERDEHEEEGGWLSRHRSMYKSLGSRPY